MSTLVSESSCGRGLAVASNGLSLGPSPPSRAPRGRGRGDPLRGGLGATLLSRGPGEASPRAAAPPSWEPWASPAVQRSAGPCRRPGASRNRWSSGPEAAGRRRKGAPLCSRRRASTASRSLAAAQVLPGQKCPLTPPSRLELSPASGSARRASAPFSAFSVCFRESQKQSGRGEGARL